MCLHGLAMQNMKCSLCPQVQLLQNRGIQRNFIMPATSAFCKGSESLLCSGMYKRRASFYVSHIQTEI